MEKKNKSIKNDNIILSMPKNITLIYFICLSLLIVLGVLLILFIPNSSSVKRNIFKDIGIALISGSIVGIFSFSATLVSRKSKDEEKLLRTVKQMGISNYYNRRYIGDEWSDFMKMAKEFDLLGYGLGTFRKENRLQFRQWLNSKEMRLLVINPSSEISNQRDREERDHIGKISTEVVEITNDIINLKYELKMTKPIIKWYNAIPSINIMRIGNNIYIGPYFVDKTSGNSCTIRLVEDSQLFKVYKEHFDSIWNDQLLSVDPSFLEEFPELISLKKRYSDNTVIFIVGGSCAGKSSALEFLKEKNYIVAEWSSIMKKYFESVNINFTKENILKVVNDKGIQFFPIMIMKNLLNQYLTQKGKTMGFVISGGRNIKEINYLASFFNSTYAHILIINANSKIRYDRHRKRDNHMSYSEFMKNDYTNIILDAQESNKFIKGQQINSIDNNLENMEDFKSCLIDYFSKFIKGAI